MSGAPRLELRQSQSLVLTPQLQQSLKILQYSTQELLNYIEAELEKNPLLSIEEAMQPENKEDERDFLDEGALPRERDISDTTSDESYSQKANENLDTDYDNTWGAKENETPSDSSFEAHSYAQDLPNRQGRVDFDDSSTSLEQNISGAKTLRDYLMEQITMEFTSSQEMMIASHLVDMLDESGYLTKDTGQLEELLGCTNEEISAVIEKLQQLDPPGVFARNLSECLKLQLADKDRLDPAMESLMDNLELCAKGEFKRLEKICGVDKEDILDMISEIKTLDPKPGSNFETDIVQTLVPDIYVRRNPLKKDWVVELNNEALPRLLVNRKYYSEIKSKVSGEMEKKYLSEQINTANWLVKTLNQRAETILKVATEIVSQQNEFFEQGIKYLKPMTLRNIAEVIGMHESTVGRVTTNKYIATPRGTFELKFFFSSSVGDSESEEGEMSSRTVKYRIKELIDKEDNEDILSDERIVKTLTGEGIAVARRTVTKYREAMGIPTSSQRRRQKRLQAVK